jgi:hypothetical protein
VRPAASPRRRAFGFAEKLSARHQRHKDLRAAVLDPATLTDPGPNKNLLKAPSRALPSSLLTVTIDGRGAIADGYHGVSFAYWLSPNAGR